MCGGLSAKDFRKCCVRVDVFVLSRVFQYGMEMDVIGYHCARVVFNERGEKDIHYERRTTDEMCYILETSGSERGRFCVGEREEVVESALKVTKNTPIGCESVGFGANTNEP